MYWSVVVTAAAKLTLKSFEEAQTQTRIYNKMEKSQCAHCTDRKYAHTN